MIDSEGFRLGVGIIIASQRNHLFWARRVGHDAWQFPQGGLADNEDPEQALFRELFEEVGLASTDVTILGSTESWLTYYLPKHFVRRETTPTCIGQKQKWYLLRLIVDERKIRLDRSNSPEFDSWRWVTYWYPVRHVIPFKATVYKQALKELEHLLFAEKQ